MVECTYDHLFQQEYVLESENIELDDENNYRENLPKKHCPICQLKVITDGDITKYLKAKVVLSNKEIVKEIKGKFSTYEDFTKFNEKQL
jgi:hypothetical protein